MVSEKSLGFGKFGLGKEKIQITKTVLVVMSQIWDLVLIGTKDLKWSQISPNSACKSQISFQKMLRSLGLGLGLETFAKFLRVSVSVSKNLVSEKKSRFRFRKNLVSEKSLGFGFGKFGIGKNVSVSVSVKILVSSFSVSKFGRKLRRNFFCLPIFDGA